jgi:hypothetical protein
MTENLFSEKLAATGLGDFTVDLAARQQGWSGAATVTANSGGILRFSRELAEEIVLRSSPLAPASVQELAAGQLEEYPYQRGSAMMTPAGDGVNVRLDFARAVKPGEPETGAGASATTNGSVPSGLNGVTVSVGRVSLGEIVAAALGLGDAEPRGMP